MQNNINQLDKKTDTTVQIQLIRAMLPQVADIALKRDMKYSLKVA